MTTRAQATIAGSALAYILVFSACSSSRQETPVVGPAQITERSRATVLTSAEIEALPSVSSVVQLLLYIPGVTVDGAGGVYVQGNSGMPLFLIDDVPSSSPNTALSLNPRDVERIEVVKDAAATSRYGFRGSHGVILIWTR